MIRVRFAPSPTGALHIGGVRTALYNYLLAKKHGGTFILRIEDTDQTRFVPGAEAYIVNSLRWLGIMPTEGPDNLGGDYAPYRQSERKAIYAQYAQQLLDNGKAYIAFDTPEELATKREAVANFQYGAATRLQMRNSLTMSAADTKTLIDNGNPYVIRMKIPENQEVVVSDLIRGEVTIATNELDDKVLMKGDGMPTYHLANIVDDYLMKITHVIRGEEWLPSAGHHVLLYQFLGWEASMPKFSHLPLILKPDGNGKLSKRDGAKFGFPVFPMSWNAEKAEDSFPGFDAYGFLPAAVNNFLALLGWSSGTDQEIFSMDELATLFSLEKINKAGARFNYDKAKWFNQQYIMATDNADLAAMVRPIIEKQLGKTLEVSEPYLQGFCGLMKERVVLLPDFWDNGSYFFTGVQVYDNERIKKSWKPENRSKMDTMLAKVAALDTFDAATIEQCVKDFMATEGLKPGEVLPIWRLALSGTMQGPAVFDMAALLGKAETLDRWNKAFDIFENC
jgi:glutamyl-tRNA synthetase